MCSVQFSEKNPRPVTKIIRANDEHGENSDRRETILFDRCFANAGGLNEKMCRIRYGSHDAVIKVLHRPMLGTTKEVTYNQRVRMACKYDTTNHPGCRHVLKVIDMFTLRDLYNDPYRRYASDYAVVMPYLNGGNWFERRNDPDVRANLWVYTEQLIEGLRFLHQNSIIHSDIKPFNVMLHRDGASSDPIAVIVDFTAAVDRGEEMRDGTAFYVLSDHIVNEDQDYFALVMTVYVVLDYDVIKTISKTYPVDRRAATMDAAMQERNIELITVAARLKSKYSFRLDLSSYRPQWPALR